MINNGKRGPYHRYTSDERARIGKFAVECGVKAAVRRYSKEYPKINESTVRGFKTLYLEELSRKRRMGDDDEITELQPKKRGRPLILGETLDDAVQKYVLRPMVLSTRQ